MKQKSLLQKISRLDLLLVLAVGACSVVSPTPVPLPIQQSPISTTLPTPTLASTQTPTLLPTVIPFTATPATPKLKIGIAAGGGGESVDKALQQAAKEYDWEFVFNDAYFEGKDSVLAVIEKGASLVIADMDYEGRPIEQAKEFPNIYFIVLDWSQIYEADDLPPNVYIIGGLHYEQIGFLGGVTAGLTSQSKFVGLFNDSFLSLIGPSEKNGFIQGLKYVCPECTAGFVQEHGHNARDLAGSETTELINQGADIFFVG